MISKIIKSFKKKLHSITSLFTSGNQFGKEEPDIDQNQECFTPTFLKKGDI